MMKSSNGKDAQFGLTDLVNLELLQKLQDGFAESYNMPSIIYGSDGTPITKPSGFTPFCEFVRSTSKGIRNCKKFDSKLLKKLSKNREPFIRKGCALQNIITGTVPIVIEDMHIANFGIGQLVEEDFDFAEIKSYAKEIEVDENVLLTKAKSLVSTTSNDFEKAVHFITILAEHIENLAVHTLQQNRLTDEVFQEKERLAVTLQSIGDGVITTDTDSKICLINKITEKLTGWSQQEAVSKPIQEVFNIINEKTGKPCENPVEKTLTSDQATGLANNTILIAKDGTRHIIEDSCAPIFNNNNQIIGTVLVYRDVTEERRTKDELMKIKKLESVGILAGGIAHDFNNILTGILGNIELAQLYIDNSSKARPLLEKSKKASLRAKGLTAQLLTFAKGGDPVRKFASIETVITDSANFVLHGSSVRCDYSFPQDLWQVNLDIGQIGQVIQNIIINAVHAMPEGGIIEVICENYTNQDKELSLPEPQYVKITIADYGTGIPAKFLDKIFDPYFTTKGQGNTKSSGLGLSICHSIIAKHDGHIEVQSEQNKGTVFTIYLPASNKDETRGSWQVQERIEVAHKATIMIMDDDSMIRDMVKLMLSQSGHEVLLAKNGHEAIEKYNEYYKSTRSIDIIIMDLTIPGAMGGKDAVQEILKINPEAKVVVASGYDDDQVMSHCQEYGFAASIAKPFQLAELNKVINEVLLKK